MTTRHDPLAAVLAGAGLVPGLSVAPVARAPRPRTVDPSTPRCALPCLYKRNGRCQFCGNLAPGRRGRGSRVTPAPRLCADEKAVQQQCIGLYVAIGCRYSAKGDTDVYVLGTHRPRALPGIAHKTFQTPGIADLWVFLPPPKLLRHARSPAPTFVWHEVKADDGGPSEAQLRFEAKCQARGIWHVMGGLDAQRAFLVEHGFLREAA